MQGTIFEAIAAMESGIYNFCKDGKCIGCGNCCTALLPVSHKEIKEIKRYVKKHHIKPVVHNALLVHKIDLTCPFLDNMRTDNKCLVYPVRPKICRLFQCNKPPEKIKDNKEMIVNMWNIDWEDKK